MASSRTILRGGRVIDPSLGVDRVCDVIIAGDIIEGLVDSGGQYDEGDVVRDVAGCIVVPGLIDIHVHCYQHATPLGIDVDTYSIHRGVTTAVDAGSAGATTFVGLRKFIAERAKTRVLAFLNIAMHGLAAGGCTGRGLGGELDSLNQVSVEQAKQCIENNRDMIVGVKVRLTADAANDGKNEAEALRRGLTVSTELGLPIMIHHSFSTVPLGTEAEGQVSCPSGLPRGSIYTHMLHGYQTTIIDENAKGPNGEHIKIHDYAVSAQRDQGVYMDIGHGQGSFTWTTAELAAKQGVWPDLISTDLHSGCAEGPAYDLVTVMTKLLHVGMPLEAIIAAVTKGPAEALQRADKHQLRAGAEADVTVLRLDGCDVELEDCQAQLRRISKRIVPVAVWRAGSEEEIIMPEPGMWPNKERLPLLSQEWKKLIVRDPQPPAAMLLLKE